MTKKIKHSGEKFLNGHRIIRYETLQNLWDNYGDIKRYFLDSKEQNSVIVKRIDLTLFSKTKTPSQKRKIQSYNKELHFYQNFSNQCSDNCKIPRYISSVRNESALIFILEDLATMGFDQQKKSVTWKEIQLCISWLANFHASFIGEKSEGLWKIGTYWHLQTRLEELNALQKGDLKSMAVEIDAILNQAKFKTCVHGDAKLDNFCFGYNRVAAVDFQYVGLGCGIKDLVYFMDSCLNPTLCARYETQILECYFSELKVALVKRNKILNFLELEAEWRQLYPFAWADLYRFLRGWSKEAWTMNSYADVQIETVKKCLQSKG